MVGGVCVLSHNNVKLLKEDESVGSGLIQKYLHLCTLRADEFSLMHIMASMS